MINNTQKIIDILLIQENGSDREVIKSKLAETQFKFNMIEADTIELANAQIQESKFDIIFLDYHFSGTSAVELLRMFKGSINSENVAFIVIALNNDDDIIFECLNEGIQDFIYKENISPLGLKRAIYNAQFKSNLESNLHQSNIKLKQLSEKDALTGLLNRPYFDKKLTEHFEQPDQSRNFTLVLLDINNFKTVNDLYGHKTGDDLLVKFADIVKSAIPKDVLFARLAGNEFALFLDSRTYDAHLACQAIYKALDHYVSLGEMYQKITASIGYAMSPKDALNKTKLYQCADLALYYSKANRNQIPYGFSSSMQKASLERTEMKSVINQAYTNNDFSIHYQPIISSVDDSLVGFEALMRLKKDDIYIPPDKFIKVLEEMKLIHELGYWLIEQVLKQQAKWLKKSKSALKFSINLSPVQLNNEKIIAYIFEMIKKYKINPNLVNFELTETILLDSPSRVKLILKKISDYSCRISLDDFGTGFSSLSHLKEFPINTVKIDKSMIPQNKHDKKSIDIMRGLSMMLNSLGLDIVAEGIETKFQLDLCKELKIPNIQGYIYDKPLEPSAVEQKYFNWKKKFLNIIPDFK